MTRTGKWWMAAASSSVAVAMTAAVGLEAVAGLGVVCTTSSPNCQLPDQLGHGTGSTLAATSDPDAGDNGIFVADNFSPQSNGTVTGACWWGIYFDFGTGIDCGPGSGDDFEITYYLNGPGNVPGAVLAGPFVVSPSKAATGNVLPGSVDVDEFEYTATHLPVAVSAGECYWIEIQNDPAGLTCNWLWSAAPPGDERSAQDGDGNGYSAPEATDYDLAFCLLDVELNVAAGCSAPSNDTCGNAIPIGNETVAFDTANASTSGSPETLCDVNGDAQVGSDVWYRYTAQCNGDVTLDLCASSYNTKVAVYQGGCPAGANQAIACNDDFCGMQSSLTFAASGGTTYYIRVGGFQGEQGEGMLTVTGPTCVTPPANNNCGSAAPVSVGTTAFTTVGATTDGFAESSCGGGGQIENDVWYRFSNPDCDQDITVGVCGADFDTKIAVYGPFCPGGPDLAIACNDDSCGLQSQLSFPGTPGSIYRIRVGSADGSTGSGSLSLSCGPPAGCEGDTNNDNVVNVTDLVNVILDWGCTDPPDTCVGDVTGDSIVNVSDLVAVILAWGNC